MTVLTANPVRLWRQWRRHPDRWWHRASTALLCLTVAQCAGWEPRRQLVALGIGAVFGGGALSPDCDAYGWWRALDRYLPDEWLGHGGPLIHHGITHWPGTALLVGWLAAMPATLLGATWAGWLVGLAWLGHQAGDWLIGYGGQDVRQGIPLLPWWAHHGLGLGRSGGPLAKGLTVTCWALTGWRLAASL